MSEPKIISSIAEARSTVLTANAEGVKTGVVPTMGALDPGHLSLVAESNRQCGLTVVTIFVNPTQFAEGEDLDAYPRTLDADLQKLSDYDVDFVFVPSSDEMYPEGFSTYVQPPDVANRLEGEFRPTHFRGVATVVLKLFQAVPAESAFFGEKDFQQCAVIEKMVHDLNLGVQVVRCPIVREADGIAMSSRNQYLDSQERERALSLSRGLNLAQQMFDDGERNAAKLEAEIRESLMDGRVDRIDYVAIVDSDRLQPLETLDRPAVALIAASVGTTRLIDNRRLG